MKLPKMMLKKLDPAKVFNSLHIVDTTNAGLASSYYLLTTDQRAYVDELINICETYFQYQIDDFNENLEEAEEEIAETLQKKDADKYSVYEE